MSTTVTPAPATDDAHADWRGVGAEDRDAIPDPVSLVLRDRSRRLLGSLLAPHQRTLWLLLAVVLVENASRLAIPYLVKEGIDRGIPPMQAGRFPP